MATCWTCGNPAAKRCGKCAADICLTDTRYYVDEANIAITMNAIPECVMCSPPTYPRPYTLVRAVAQGEWEPDW
jgi:hypothetical protein